MQKQSFYSKRALFYWSRIYSSQILTGDKYDELKPVIGIHFLDFKLFENSNGYHSVAKINRKDLKTGFIENFTNDLTLHFIEMPKCATINKELETWIYILNQTHTLSEDQMKSIIKETPELEETFDTFEKACRNPRIITRAEMEEKTRRDNYGIINYGIEEGVRKGVEKAVGKAVEEAVEKAEGKKIKDIILKMNRKGIEVDQISDLLDFSVDEIKNILSLLK